MFRALLSCVLFLLSLGGILSMAYAVSSSGTVGSTLREEAVNPGDIAYVAAIRFNGKPLPDYYDLLEGEDGKLYLPVEPIFTAGEAMVAAEPERLYLAVGSTGAELSLDLGKGVLIAGGVERPLLPEDYRLREGAYLLAEPILAETFLLETKFDPATQELLIKSGRPFPRDLRLARERAWDKLGQGGDEFAPVRLQAQDYTLLGSPQADISLNAHSSGSGAVNSTWSGLVVGEALYLTHHLYAGGDGENALSGLRLRSGRMSPEGGVFGVAPLYEAQGGDVGGLHIPLVGNGGSGRGVKFLATPLRSAANFDTTLIEGDAPPGWDAELYVGQNLVNYQRVGENGRYRFQDVPLVYGTNQLKVVLYGPQGQVREELISEQIGGGMVPPGKVYGSVFALEEGNSLFDIGRDASRSGLWQIGGKADIGLAQQLTLGLFGARVSNAVEGGETPQGRDFYGLELRPSLGSLLVEAGGAGSSDGGTAGYGRFAMPLWASSLSGGYNHYDEKFVSKDSEEGNLLSRSTLRVSLPLVPWRRDLGAVGIGVEERRLRRGEPAREANLSYGHRLGPVFLGHQAELAWSGAETGEATGLYTLRASYRHDLFDLRGEAGYGLGGNGGPRAITLSGLWRENDKRRVNASVSYSPGSDSVSCGLGYTWDLGLAALSCNVTASENEYTAGVGLNFSFGHSPARGFTMDSSSRAAMGFADLQIFEDVDSDGLFTAGLDKPLPNAGVLVNKRPLADRASDGKGRLGIDSLSIYDPLEIQINSGSLPDPFLVPQFPAVRAWPRPGQAVELFLPLSESGEISGYARIALPVATGAGKDKGDGQVAVRPLAGIRLQVVNGEGQVHAETVASSDGYFMFDTVFPGRWQVRIAPGQSFRGISLDAGSGTDIKAGGRYRPIEVRITKEMLRSEELELVVGQMDSQPVAPLSPPGGSSTLDVRGGGAQAFGTSETKPVSKVGDTHASSSQRQREEFFSSSAGKVLVEKFLESWAKAWATRDVATYLSLYDESFTPPGKKTRAQWQRERQVRLRNAKFIDIQLDNVMVSFARNGVWRVEVDQRYVSDIFQDQCRKVLEIGKGVGGLKILREETLGDIVN